MFFRDVLHYQVPVFCIGQMSVEARNSPCACKFGENSHFAVEGFGGIDDLRGRELAEGNTFDSNLARGIVQFAGVVDDGKAAAPDLFFDSVCCGQDGARIYLAGRALLLRVEKQAGCDLADWRRCFEHRFTDRAASLGVRREGMLTGRAMGGGGIVCQAAFVAETSQK